MTQRCTRQNIEYCRYREVPIKLHATSKPIDITEFIVKPEPVKINKDFINFVKLDGQVLIYVYINNYFNKITLLYHLYE